MARLNTKQHRYTFETATSTKGTWSQDAAMMKFYTSKPWRFLRADCLSEEPLCRQCKKEGRLTTAKVLDHIIPIRLGGERLDKKNLQPLCHSCHNTKSAKERHGNNNN